MKTLNIKITGQVQGVGFRPFIYRLAKKLKLRGWVQNCSGEVMVEAQAKDNTLELFLQSILLEHPPLAIPHIESTHWIERPKVSDFSIQSSALSQHAERHIPADYFICSDCIDELTHSDERRYRYPFINCTQCGPRYTIIHELPYDRPNTSMSSFPLCPECQQEYTDPLDRRFHAQPLACAECGPELSLIFTSEIDDQTHSATKISGNEASLSASVSALRDGKIIAIKGIGGYHLICDATNEQAVKKLRQRKQRPHKPLAVMFASSANKPLAQLKQYCSPAEAEIFALTSPQRPIVLITTHKNLLAPSINPGLNQLGVMLAYSPLHHLLLNDFGLPIVATSGNLSGEPVLTDNQQAIARLNKITDIFLQHNREIIRPADDSVLRIIQKKVRLLRIGRGLAPLEINLPYTIEHPILALGGQMKNTIALAWGTGEKSRVVISPHIGELESLHSIEVFHQVIDDLCHLYQIKPQQIICDKHPGYYTSRYAKSYAEQHNIPLTQVQHHKAHASIVSGEFDISQSSDEHQIPWLIFSWDGTGLGDDQSIWGGEGFYGNSGHWQRVCSIKPFYLQGGDKAAKEPWRSACALLWEKDIQGVNIGALSKQTKSLAFRAWQKRINTHQCSSMGRLFDAASALLELGNYSSFAGQGPMLLEALLDKLADNENKYVPQPLPLYEEKSEHQAITLFDWSDLVPMLLDKTQSIEQRALCFHHRIAETLVSMAKKVRQQKGDIRIGLSGGVFQNKYLTEFVFKRLQEEQFSVFLPEKVPYNDAGLAFGQIIEGIHQ